jgi:putative exosortase-associated protein (TIGR04073 family)
MNKLAAALILGAAIGLAGTAAADESASAGPSYGELSGRKLGRGLSNTTFGWVELPGGIQGIGERHGVGAAATWGVLHGAGRAIQRTAIGIFEVLTFPLGTPTDFEPLIEPEFVFSDSE